MEYRKSAWTESISNLLRRTEMNLQRIQTPYHDEISKIYNPTYIPSYYDKPAHDHPQIPPSELREDSSIIIQQEISSVKLSLKKMLQDRMNEQKKDLESINDRLYNLEATAKDLNRFKEDARGSINSIEKKFLAEIKKIEVIGKGFASQEEVKSAVDSVRTANLTAIKRVESDIEHIRIAESEYKEEVYKANEEKFREISKKFVSNYEFSRFREEILSETKENLREIEESFTKKFGDLKKSHETHSSEDFGGKLSEININLDRKEENLYQKIQQVEKRLDKTEKRNKETLKRLESDIEKLSNLTNTEDLEHRFSSLQKELSSLPKAFPNPDFSNLTTKAELSTLTSKMSELETLKKDLNSKIFAVEQRITALEHASESSEIDIDLALKPDSMIKGAAPFSRLDAPITQGFTKICINDFGESDSESHGYTSPHTSPMNQIPITVIKADEKKSNQFDFKHKTDLHIRTNELKMIHEDPVFENKKKSQDSEVDFMKDFDKESDESRSSDLSNDRFEGKIEAVTPDILVDYKENEGRSKKEEKIVRIEEVDFDLGKPAAKILKPTQKQPALSKPIEDPMIVDSPINDAPSFEIKEISHFTSTFTEEFIDNEIDIGCHSIFKHGANKTPMKIQFEKIPDSIKGLNMQQFRPQSSDSIEENSSDQLEFESDIELP